ncbi:mitotic spindle checkpoint protein MAD1 [Mercurialis annua]|uniref:mitotic spindle checkpoint protein MAD1 n=1 Tax=Mercurialis annua TaxID=3986 RepID=UPI00215E12F9|nr:mitotic spindle checkpoint protein MAD1 [Mercurialis annua]XP_050210698.1 mitotic spindle checkpoint protein MAD1 [Mercurialis annua]XP_050210699.1 mitotic spindle checkpoint protein MAD1 [Mercurialis annua]
MILRTPPAKRPRDDTKPYETSPVGSDRRLVIYEDAPDVIVQHPESSLELHQHQQESSDHMLCTYQCRQMVKSEFLDALTNAEKQVLDYQSKLESLDENFSKADAERKKFRDQFLFAEQELAAAKGREKALQGQLLKDINDSQERFKKQIESYRKLEVKLENEMNLRKKAESSAATAEEKASVLEGKLANLSESSVREKKHLNNELVQLQRDSKLAISRITADHEKMECRAKNAEKESVLLKQQYEDLKLQLSECLHQRSELEKKISSFTIQEGSSSESNILVQHLQEELRNCESEVREARKLKSSYENVELLKEKLLEEKGRRERAELELSKFQELELNMRKLEDELSSWKFMIKEIPDVSCCDDIPNKFAALQKEMIDNMMKLGEANARLKQMEVALDAAQLGKQDAETEAASAKEKAECLKLEVNRTASLLSIVVEERDGLQKIVNGLRRSKNDQAEDESAGGTRLQELESSLLKKESYIKELESNLHEQKKANNGQLDEIKLLNDRLNNEARRFKSLERESDRLRSEISLLESKLGHGDFSAANTKVLRMVNTLGVDNDAKQTIESLCTELQKTKEKLQALEELKNQPGDAGKLVDSYISGKITQLKEHIATLEKREERYKTVFADRISVFRRACCELFGYKIVMDEHQRPNGIPVTRFTLQSIYAQSEDEKLEFEYESGNTNILGNTYTSQSEISRQVDIFIRKMNSIPAFTANLTVESFNKRTLC